MAQRITITFTRYAEPNWLLRDTIDSVGRQQRIEADVLFLDQHHDEEMRAYVTGLSTENLNFQYIVIPARSLSFARNKAIELSDNDIILFMDSDAIAGPQWAYHLQKVITRPNVGVVGSKIVPRWHKRPLFLARSQMVRRHYSMLDLGEQEVSTVKLWGAGYGIHRGRLGSNAYFEEGIGRQPGLLLGGEETDLCVRAVGMGLESLYNPLAVVEHQVLPERITYRWLMRRFYFSGVERAVKEGSLQPSVEGRVFMDYLAYAVTLPAVLLGYWHGRRTLAEERKNRSKEA